MRAVRRLADEHEPLVADEVEERVVVVGFTIDRMRGTSDRIGRLIGGRALSHRTSFPAANKHSQSAAGEEGGGPPPPTPEAQGPRRRTPAATFGPFSDARRMVDRM